ncbi:hypothetical protein [Methyloceanibacter marginalis]|jgi:hypothetical protein|uniref:hypothetical protein n=1 Tax=Methyloceanibacter marginalis TaxID=1774971 RepID=UPI00114D0295|nr:hypothetical protein [Methyloceanibacter marginalis]
MSHIFPILIRAFLAAAFVLGGVITHANSVVHASASDFGSHEHLTHAGATSDSVDFGHTDKGDPSRTLGLCIDAHCCTPGVYTTAQDVQRHSPSCGKFVFELSSNYALSVALSLLKPPRAIT